MSITQQKRFMSLKNKKKNDLPKKMKFKNLRLNTKLSSEINAQISRKQSFILSFTLNISNTDLPRLPMFYC